MKWKVSENFTDKRNIFLIILLILLNFLDVQYTRIQFCCLHGTTKSILNILWIFLLDNVFSHINIYPLVHQCFTNVFIIHCFKYDPVPILIACNFRSTPNLKLLWALYETTYERSLVRCLFIKYIFCRNELIPYKDFHEMCRKVWIRYVWVLQCFLVANGHEECCTTAALTIHHLSKAATVVCYEKWEFIIDL